MNNQEIRKSALKFGIKQWQIADKLGIREETFSRKLRYELPQDEKERILSIIEELKGAVEV